MSIKSIFTLAVRFTQRRPLFCLNIVLLLCLGIGLSISTFGLVHYVLIESLPYRDGDELMLVHDVYAQHNADLLGVSEPEILDFQNLSQSFAGFAAMLSIKPTLTLPEPRRISGALVTVNLLPVLGVVPRLGRSFVKDDENAAAPAVAIVSSRLYESLSCPQIYGCRLTIQGQPHAVVGVLPQNFRLPNDLVTREQTDLLLPLGLDPANLGPRDNPRFTVLGRLRKAVEPTTAQAEMASIAEILRSRHPDVYTPDMGYMIRLHAVRDTVLGDASFALKVAILAATMLFFIALTNAGNFLLVASEQRTSSFLTLFAIGAPTGILRAQLFVEACLLAALSFLPGITLGWLLFTFVTRLSAGRLLPLLRDAQLSSTTVVFAILLLILAAAILFLIPQAALMRTKRLIPAIHREGRNMTPTGGGARIQNLLLIVQTAFSTALIVLFLVVGLSQHRLYKVDLGFHTDGVHVAEVMAPTSSYEDSPQVLGFFDSLLAQARLEKGLEHSCLSTFPPLVQQNETWPFDVSGRSTTRREPHLAVSVEIASGGCLKVLSIPLLEGSDLPLQKVAGSSPAALVSESLATRLWPAGSAIGQRIRPRLTKDAPWATVVGVVADVRHEGPNAELLDTVYLHYSDVPALTGISVRLMRLVSVSPQSSADVRKRMRRAVAEVSSSVPVEYLGTLGDLSARLTAPWKFTGQLLSIASIVGPIIALSGLYSILSTLIVLRRKELGIRIALGATKRNLVLLLSRRMLLRLLGGGLVGVWIALTLFLRLRAFMPGTTLPEAAVASLLVVLALLGIGILASVTLLPSVTAKAANAYRE